MLFTVLILLVTGAGAERRPLGRHALAPGVALQAPAGELYWRAPAVGVGMAVFSRLWVIVDCRTGGHCPFPVQTSV